MISSSHKFCGCSADCLESFDIFSSVSETLDLSGKEGIAHAMPCYGLGHRLAERALESPSKALLQTNYIWKSHLVWEGSNENRSGARACAQWILLIEQHCSHVLSWQTALPNKSLLPTWLCVPWCPRRGSSVSWEGRCCWQSLPSSEAKVKRLPTRGLSVWWLGAPQGHLG